MTVSNRTPHELTIWSEDQKVLLHRFQPVGSPIRINPPVTERSEATPFPAVKLLPFEKDDVVAAAKAIVDDPAEWVFVPRMILDAITAENRGSQYKPYDEQWALGEALDKAVAPDTGPDSVVRDDQGNVIGVRRVIHCR